MHMNKYVVVCFICIWPVTAVEGEGSRQFFTGWSGWDTGSVVCLPPEVLRDIDHSLCSTEMVAWARIQVMAGFCRRSLRLGSLLARHS